MNIDAVMNADPILLGIVAGGFVALLGLAIALRAASTAARAHERLERHETELMRMQSELAHLDAGGSRTADHQAEMAQRLALLSEQQEQLMLRDDNAGPYLQAIRLARRGEDATSLMSTCGLSRGEAELIARLHGLQAQGAGSEAEAGSSRS